MRAVTIIDFALIAATFALIIVLIGHRFPIAF